MCLFTSTSVLINVDLSFYLQIRPRPKAEGWWGESGLGSVKAGINREASFRDKMPKNHDNVNIPDLRCHVVHFLWQIWGWADLISCCPAPVGRRDADPELPSSSRLFCSLLISFYRSLSKTESHLTSGGLAGGLDLYFELWTGAYSTNQTICSVHVTHGLV